MKEFFQAPGDFLQKNFAQLQRERTKMQKGRCHIDPEVPQWTQQRAESQEIQPRSQHHAHGEVEPQLSPGGAQCVADGTGRYGQTEQHVAYGQQTLPAPPHGAQQVVSQSQNGAQKGGAGENVVLLEKREEPKH